MKKLLHIFTLLLVVSAYAGDASAPVAPSASLEWFVGGTWVATLPPQKDGTTVGIELKFERPENNQGLRFDSSFIFGGRRAPYSSGMYAWNAAKQKFAIFYTDSGGSLNMGDVTPDGNVLFHEFTATDKAGKIEYVQVKLTKVSADSFTNEISVQKEGKWEKVVDVRYDRRKEDRPQPAFRIN